MVIPLMDSGAIILKINIMIRNLYVLIFLLLSLRLFSQTDKIPLLERDVTICANGVTAQSVLTAIAQQADFVFSYSPSVIPQGNVSICIEHQPVRVVLNTLFNGAIDYSTRGKYIILKKSKVDTVQNAKKIVEGYIIDSKTGERITDASIYDKEQMLSAITNKYGYFKLLEVPKGSENIQLHLSKQGYADTLVVPTKKDKDFFNIKLTAKPIFEKTKSSEFIESPLLDSVSNRSWLPSWLLTQPIRIHVRNVSDTLFKSVQISFLPFISTNKLLTANTANDISINILAGYTQEVRKFEVGGILNIVRKDVKSAQFSGVGNIVGGSFKGVQAAGIFNIVRDSLRGAQLAGIGNILEGSFTGLQSAGTFNICNTFNGLQLSGILNFSTEFAGAQIAGIFNKSRVSDGLQLSGIINTTRKIRGYQITGVANMTNYIKGTQVAGLLNIATCFDGYQIGTVNIADTCDGIPFGFFSFVKKGYHKLEFSFDEMRVTGASFRTGVKLFHNIFSVGINPSFSRTSLWTYGYGLGTSIGNPDKTLWDIDLSSNRFIKDNNWSSENVLYRFYTGIDWHISKKTSIAAGLTYNFLVTNRNETDFNNSISNLIPYTISNSNSGSNSNLKTWLGGRIAIRFF